jgi:hypothetical protein
MVDKGYEDSMQRYKHARSLVEGTVRVNSESMIAHIDTSGQGVPVAVFNALSWPRTDETAVEFAFSDSGVRKFALFDSDGATVQFRFLTRSATTTAQFDKHVSHSLPAIFSLLDMPSITRCLNALPTPNSAPTSWAVAARLISARYSPNSASSTHLEKPVCDTCSHV